MNELVELLAEAEGCVALPLSEDNDLEDNFIDVLNKRELAKENRVVFLVNDDGARIRICTFNNAYSDGGTRSELNREIYPVSGEVSARAVNYLKKFLLARDQERVNQQRKAQFLLDFNKKYRGRTINEVYKE